MNEGEKKIADLMAGFIGLARERQATPPEAASAMMAAASAVLIADFGEFAAIEMMHAVLDEASAILVARSTAGSC